MQWMRIIGGVVLSTSLATVAIAQDKPEDFPRRPLTVIVPYGAGGGSDQLSRAMAGAMEPILGEPIQVVNRPGGGGMAAVPSFMTAPADGYTMLEAIDEVVTNYVAGRLDEHPAEDWYPVCMAQITFSQLYIRTDDERFEDWSGFLDYARNNQASLANLGNLGSMERVTMHLLQTALDFETNQIAFDKPSERYAALIGGQVDALFEQPGDVKAYMDAGQIKPILTFYGERPEVFADVPTHQEAGADFEPLLRFRGFWVLPSVPEERRDYLETVCAEAFKSDSFQKFNASKFMTLIDSYRDAQGSRELINDAIETYTRVYQDIGLETRE